MSKLTKKTCVFVCFSFCALHVFQNYQLLFFKMFSVFVYSSNFQNVNISTFQNFQFSNFIMLNCINFKISKYVFVLCLLLLFFFLQHFIRFVKQTRKTTLNKIYVQQKQKSKFQFFKLHGPTSIWSIKKT